MAAHAQPNLHSPESEPQKQQETFTIQEAADVLNVGGAYLVQLLDTHKLPSHGAGEQRSIAHDDLFDYKQARDILRRMYLRDLARLSIEYSLDDVDYSFLLEDADSSNTTR
jgi:excisionase family DNA binding protein